MEQLTRTGHDLLLWYVLQQIEQFRKMGKEFAMHHAGTEHMGEWEEELQMAVLETIPVEKRLRGLAPAERLRGLPPEERLRGLPPEERLRGLSPEEVLIPHAVEDVTIPQLVERVNRCRARYKRFTPEEIADGLTDAQAAQLRDLLDRRQKR